MNAQKISEILRPLYEKAKAQVSRIRKQIQAGQSHQSRLDFAEGLEAGILDAILTIESLPDESITCNHVYNAEDGICACGATKP